MDGMHDGIAITEMDESFPRAAMLMYRLFLVTLPTVLRMFLGCVHAGQEPVQAPSVTSEYYYVGEITQQQ